VNMMPGWFPGGAAGRVVSLSFFASTGPTSGSDTITLPASILAGDLIVIADRSLSTGATPTLVVPTGFTQLATQTGGPTGGGILLRLTYSAKISGGADSSAVITGQTANVDRKKYALVFRPDVPVTSFSAFDAALEGFTDGNPAAGTISAAAQTPPLVTLAVYGSSSSASLQSATKTHSPAEDAQIPVNGTASIVYLKYKIANSAPADISIDLADVASDNLLSGLGVTVS
jgi:hypothetical protein